MKDSTKSSESPALLVELCQLLRAHRAAFAQERTFQRMVALLFGELFSFARHTVTQALLSLGLTDADWSAWYRLFSRPRFREDMLGRCLLRETLRQQPETLPYVVGIDATQVPRSSRKMPGTGWLKAPRTPPFRVGIHRAQRFVQGSWLVPLQEGFSRAIPLRFLAAFTPKAVPAASPACREWEAGHIFMHWLRAELDAAGRLAQPVWVLADGTYDCVALWRSLPERVTLVTRTARNRILRALPGPQVGRGRRRKYGERVPAPAAWLKEREGWSEIEVAVRGHLRRMRYRLEGPFLRERAASQPVYLLVVKGQTWTVGQRLPRRKSREPAFYLISAQQQEGAWQLPLPVPTLLAWLWQRWELEVAHREMKSGLGVGEMQCWNAQSAALAVQWSVWMYAVLVLAGYRAWGLFGGPATPGRWWGGAQRWSLNTLWRGYRAALGAPEFRAIWNPSRSNWPEKERDLIGLRNAVMGAARA